MTKELHLYNLSEDPYENFKNWYDDALILEDNADAMTLATLDPDKKRPVLRTVLFKGIIENQFTFYTNFLSNKSQHIKLNPEVGLLFYWIRSRHQIRVQGFVTKMSEENSLKYFRSRDRESQIVSMVSSQSQKIKSKNELILKVEEVKTEFRDKEIPKPSHWGGFLIEPYEFEFFIYGENRLNDRFLYEKNSMGQWIVSRLQP